MSDSRNLKAFVLFFDKKLQMYILCCKGPKLYSILGNSPFIPFPLPSNEIYIDSCQERLGFIIGAKLRNTT